MPPTPALRIAKPRDSPCPHTTQGREMSSSFPTLTVTARRSRSSFGWSTSSGRIQTVVLLWSVIAVPSYANFKVNRFRSFSLPSFSQSGRRWDRPGAEVRLLDDRKEKVEQLGVTQPSGAPNYATLPVA